MMRYSFMIFFFGTCMTLSACGPKIYSYIRSESPGVSETLVEDVTLYYAHEDTPMGAHVIDHIEETARNRDCKTAATIALVQMQKKALGKGGNALINLKTVPEDEDPMSNEEGFWCSRSKSLEEGGDLSVRVWKVTWEGDIARMGHVLEEEPAAEEEDESEKEGDDYYD